MTRAERVINAFINCVNAGQYSLDYATVLIEDNSKYGYLTSEDKQKFYDTFYPIDEEMVVEGVE